MKHIAFKMKLHPGQEEEYKRRHHAIWPELAGLLKKTGICEYAIFWDEETNILFATLKVEDPTRLDSLNTHPLMHKWWVFMKDIMDTNPDNSPLSIPLENVFYMP